MPSAQERLQDTNQLLREILRAGSVVNPQHAKAMRKAVTANKAVIKRSKNRHEKHPVIVDGIQYTVTRYYDAKGFAGTTVDSPCACFGSKMRCHSTEACPWLAKRKAG